MHQAIQLARRAFGNTSRELPHDVHKNDIIGTNEQNENSGKTDVARGKS